MDVRVNFFLSWVLARLEFMAAYFNDTESYRKRILVQFYSELLVTICLKTLMLSQTNWRYELVPGALERQQGEKMTEEKINEFSA